MPESFKPDIILSHERSSKSSVPDDFPTDPFPAALAGSQTKFSARLIEGKYVVGLTAEERHQRYLHCLDLVNQLIAYTQRKREQKPEVPKADVLDDIVNRIPLQGWDLGTSEMEWIAKQLRQSFESR
jgi:hypothetical protein